MTTSGDVIGFARLLSGFRF